MERIVLAGDSAGVHIAGQHAVQSTGLGGWFVRTIGRAYLGARGFGDPRVRQVSIVDRVTADYPPAPLSGGDDAPLTRQGSALVDRLFAVGFDREAHFTPGRGHEFQFDFRLLEPRRILDATITFLRRVEGRAD